MRRLEFGGVVLAVATATTAYAADASLPVKATPKSREDSYD